MVVLRGEGVTGVSVSRLGALDQTGQLDQPGRQRAFGVDHDLELPRGEPADAARPAGRERDHERLARDAEAIGDGEDLLDLAEGHRLEHPYFFRGRRATVVPLPERACLIAVNQMLAMTW